jgi:hypothetical protein
MDREKYTHTVKAKRNLTPVCALGHLDSGELLLNLVYSSLRLPGRAGEAADQVTYDAVLGTEGVRIWKIQY